MTQTSGQSALADELRRANDTINKLKQENEQSKQYVQQYEDHIGNLESRLSNK